MTRTNHTLEKLKERNAVHSSKFIKSSGALKQYWAKHPTRVAFLGCMDGRVNFLYITNSKAGAANGYKVAGGKFNLGFNYFGLLNYDWYNAAMSSGHDCLVFSTYHFHSDDEHLGCKGHNYSTADAIGCGKKIVQQYKKVFDDGSVFDAVLLGIDTKDHNLVFHAEHNDETCSIIDYVEKTDEELIDRLRAIFPRMSNQIFNDLVPYALGNRNHLRGENHGIIIESVGDDHEEKVIAIGRGHEFIFQTTLMEGDIPATRICLSVGPYNDEFKSNIRISLMIVKDSIEKGRIDPAEGVVLLSSAIFDDDSGVSHNWAVQKVEEYASQAIAVINEDTPEMESVREIVVPHLLLAKAVISTVTRKMEIISSESLPSNETSHRALAKKLKSAVEMQ